MWVFFENGTFYSAVADKKDKNVTWVRTRDLRSAEIFSEWLPGSEVLEWKGTDYAYRVKSHGDDWEQYTSYMIQTAKATNFKNEVGANVGHGKWMHALHDVWQVMFELQHDLKRESSRDSALDAFELVQLEDSEEEYEWDEYDAWAAREAERKAQRRGLKLGF